MNIPETPAVKSIVLKVASRCNLNCSYCYLYNHQDQTTLKQPKRIDDQIFNAVLERIATHTDLHGHTMNITFHGGEPTLVGVDRLEALICRARDFLGDRLGNLSIQTNATRINPAWAKMLSRQRVAVGVSLDGPPAIHDIVRVTHAGSGSYLNTLRGIHYLNEANVPVSILCVVNPGTDGLAIYQHFRSLGLRWIDFLLPDVSHDSKVAFYGDAPHPVADYLRPILDCWMAENDETVRIPLFWDLLSRLMGSQKTTTDCFGNPPVTYVVINTDGSIEPLDALKVCDNELTRTKFNALSNGFDDLTSSPSILSDGLNGHFELSDTCKRCRFVRVCGGGYLPHRYRRSNGFDNPSVWCEDIQLILDHMLELIKNKDGNQPEPLMTDKRSHTP